MHLNETDLLIRQLCSCPSLGLDIPEGEGIMDDFVSMLEDLSRTNLNKLVAVLYRADVPEEKIKMALAAPDPDLSIGRIFASLLVDRQREKQHFRRLYSPILS